MQEEEPVRARVGQGLQEEEPARIRIFYYLI
jgi:hypothetical protein